MRKSKFMLAVIVLFAVGFSAVSTTLYLNGSFKIGTNNADFDVKFTKATSEANAIATISPDGKSITFETSSLSTVGDISKLDFEVTNNSTMYDANVSIDCTATGTNKGYYEITKEVETPIAAQTIGVGKVEVKLVKASLTDFSEEFTCTLNGTAKERISKAEQLESNKTLYEILQIEAEKGLYAKEYTGDHQDSFNGGGTKKIFHYYASDATNAATVKNINNVIFAGQCWQMIRTTDTGGVKMIYNGEVEDGKCLDTRGTHIGYTNGSFATTQNLNENYYYGTDYNYDASTKTFSLAGTLTQATWNDATYSSLIGKYTCLSTDSVGTCSTLYYVESYKDTSNAYVLKLGTSSYYYQFGTVPFNMNYKSPAYVGYMYNTIYSSKSMSNSSSGKIEVTTEAVDSSSYSVKTNDATYPYTYDEATKQWSSSNHEDSSKSTFEFSPTVAGEYYLSYTIGSQTNYDKATFYVDGASKVIVSGSNTSYFSLGFLTTDSVIKIEYSKDDSSSTQPDKVSFSLAKRIGEIIADNRWYFGSDVTYENGVYTLVNPERFDLSIDYSNLNNNHYTCNGENVDEQTPTTKCSTVKYISYADGSKSYYIELTGGKKVENALEEMLSADNVNSKNSTMKSAVEAWYEKYLKDYTKYLEDTVYCNDRSISSLGGWNPKGGSTSSYLQFKEYSSTKDLSCSNVTDRFSTLNEKAKLKYPIGLATNPELNLLGGNDVRKTGQYYWSASPYYFGSYIAYIRVVSSSGYLISKSGSVYYSPRGARFVVSLAPGTTYIKGNGSMEAPYVVELE